MAEAGIPAHDGRKRRHYGYIEKFIETMGEQYNIREIAFDRWGAVQMVQNLEGMGFTVVPFGQGFKDMSPPTKELMKLTLEKKIAHGGHPVLRWMMDNIFIKSDPAGNIKPDKGEIHRKDRRCRGYGHGTRPCHPLRQRQQRKRI
jgi:phage terminase large subunit-like protein